jgi:hypothetical protein
VHVTAGSVSAARLFAMDNGRAGTLTTGYATVQDNNSQIETNITGFQKPHMIGALLAFPTAHDYDTMRRVSRWLGARFGASVA